MRDKSQRTLIAIIADAIVEWKDRSGWSRETVADNIIENYFSHFPDAASRPDMGLPGIAFLPPKHGDTYTRMHSNANKLFRWLDELTKDKGLLPANFIPVLISSLPGDLRLKTVNAILSMYAINMTAKPMASGKHQDTLAMLEATLQDTSEASKSIAALLDGIDPGELEHALHMLTNAISTLNAGKHFVESLMIGGNHAR